MSEPNKDDDGSEEERAIQFQTAWVDGALTIYVLTNHGRLFVRAVAGSEKAEMPWSEIDLPSAIGEKRIGSKEIEA